MKEKFPSELQEKFTVRFPDGMRDKIAELAKANNRSMNAEIVFILDSHLKDMEGVLNDDSYSLKNGSKFFSTLDDLKKIILKFEMEESSNNK